jgi:hypothetical protein
MAIPGTAAGALILEQGTQSLVEKLILPYQVQTVV